MAVRERQESSSWYASTQYGECGHLAFVTTYWDTEAEAREFAKSQNDRTDCEYVSSSAYPLAD